MNPGDISWAPLEELGELVVYPRMKPLDVVAAAATAEVILINKLPLGRDILDLLTRLRYIGVLATGYNNIDVDYCRQLRLPVANIPGYSRDSVVQTVTAFLLHICNRTWEYADSVRRGDWERSEDFSYLLNTPVELAGKVLGIAGFGDIGSRLALVAEALGMEVLVASKPDGSRPRRLGSRNSFPLEEIVSRCDVLSLHLPLVEQTRSAINTELLSCAKSGLILINTARGAVVDNSAVLTALEEGRLGWYAADVFRTEPPQKLSPADALLLHHPKAIFTPHVAWASREARQRAIAIAAANIKAWVGGEPANVVNGVMRGR